MLSSWLRGEQASALWHAPWVGSVPHQPSHPCNWTPEFCRADKILFPAIDERQFNGSEKVPAVELEEAKSTEYWF